jgi:hypothetical protein
MLAGKIILGGQTGFLDQPYVDVELRSGDTVLGPTGSGFDIYPYKHMLLDTGANSILFANDAVLDLEANGYTTEGVYEELGAGGTQEFDVSAPYEFRYSGSDEVVHTLPQTANDVRIMSNPDITFGMRASEGGIPGIVGMPAMVNRVTTLDMSAWGNTSDLFDLGAMGVTFSDTVPASSGHRYSVATDTRVLFDVRDGLPDGSPADAPLPTWAPVTFLDAMPTYQGRSETGGFLLDTGAQLSMISSQLAFDLGLDENHNGSFLDEAVETIPIIGVGGTVDIPILLIDELSIMTEEGTLLTFAGAPDEYISIAIHDVAPGIEGVLGVDLLTSGVELDVETLGIVGSPYFDRISMDFRTLATQGTGTLYFDLNPSYDNVVPTGDLLSLSLAGGYTYTENSEPILVAGDGTLASSGVVDLNGGSLVARIASNASILDQLEIQSDSSVVITAGTIAYNGVAVGTVSGGVGTEPLVVTFTADATLEAAQAVLRQISFRTTAEGPSSAQRQIEFQLHDGGGTSSNVATVTVDVLALNDAPQLDTSLEPSLPSLLEDAQNPPGVEISTLLTGASDADAGAVLGMAVVGTAGTDLGSWQYSLDNGTTWLSLDAVNSSAAVLLPAAGQTRVRFVPRPNTVGTAELQYRAWDQTQGTAGEAFDLSSAAAVGGSSAFSDEVETASVTITAVNDAPRLNASLTPTLFAINEDSRNPWGTPIGSLLQGLWDPDSNTSRGLAVTVATGAAQGTWQYTLDGGAHWQPLGAVSIDAAFLLPANGNVSRIRFIPNANVNGMVSLGYFGWDQTQGAVGERWDLSLASSRGGTTAFSNAYETASLTINPVNDAPVLNAGTTANFLSIQEDNRTSYGTPLGMLLAGVSDVDAGALKGMAITAASGLAHGVWQYTLDGGTSWQALGTVSLQTALLLPVNGNQSRIRFVPNTNFNGTVSLSFFAWDRTQGAVGDTFDISTAGSRGGTKAFSSVSRVSTLTVTPVNDPPAIHLPSSVGYTLNAPAVLLASTATVKDPDSTNFAGGWLKVQITDGADGGDRLSIGGAFRIVDGNLIWNNTATIGTVQSSGIGSTALVINLNQSATRYRVEQLVRSIKFGTVGSSLLGPRTVAFTTSDGILSSSTATMSVQILEA